MVAAETGFWRDESLPHGRRAGILPTALHTQSAVSQGVQRTQQLQPQARPMVFTATEN